MKILVVSHEYPPIGGGGANACFYLSREFVNQGHEVTVITVNYNSMQHETVDAKLRIIRVNSKRNHVDHCSFMEMMDYLLKAWPVICKLLKKEKFQMCHVFFGIPSGVLGLAAKVRFRLPYVIRFGGGDIPGAQKRFKYLYKILSPFIKLIWKNAAGLVANSNTLKEKALQFYDKCDVDIICNGVDCEQFYPQKEPDGSEIVRVLFVSRLIEGKGLQYIIPKWQEIRNESNKDIRLEVVGDGPYREELERMVNQFEQGEFISFHGSKSKTELVKYYQESDIFILPSLSEGMPNVVLEAMAAGLPVVMTPCGGSTELINGNGIITEISEFHNSILQLCIDENERILMGKLGRNRALTEFSWKEMSKKYILIFSYVTKMRVDL